MPEFTLPPFTSLATDKLILRQLRITDANEIMLLRSNDRVNEFIDRPRSTDLNDAEKFIEKINNAIDDKQSMYWAITLKESDTLIGTICYWNLVIEKNMAEIGYELHPDYQGKGIMQEAIKKIIDFGFKQLKLQIIIALPHPGNTKSINILLKNHFSQDENYEYVNKEEKGDLSVYYLENLQSDQ